MICKNCDSVIEDNATVCPYCLTPVSGRTDPPPGPVPPGPPARGGNPNLVIGIITGLLGLGFLVEAFLYFVVLAP